jgi:hypothetical protein
LCNSRDVPQIGAVVFCTGSSVRNPASIIGLFSSSPSQLPDFLSQGSSMKAIRLKEK